jgi:hypothetical protein
LGLGGRKKHAHTTDKADPAGSDVDGGGAAAPSASTPPSAKSDRASNGNTGERSPLRRTTSAPHPGHRRQGLLQEPGSSRRLGWPPRSLNQLSPEDTSPAHGLGNPTPALVPLVDGPARLRPTKLPFSSQLCLCPCCHRCLRLWLIAERPRVPLTKQEKPRAARPTEPRDSYATGIRIPHSSPSHEATHTWLSGSVSRQASPSARNEEKIWYYTQKYLHVQAPTTTMNKHWHSRCHYKQNSGSTPVGTNNPPHWRACGATKPQVAHRRPLRQQRQRPSLRAAEQQQR